MFENPRRKGVISEKELKYFSSEYKKAGDFLKKIKNVGNIPENTFLVIADVVGLYPNVPHNTDLKALSNMLEARERT